MYLWKLQVNLASTSWICYTLLSMSLLFIFLDFLSICVQSVSFVPVLCLCFVLPLVSPLCSCLCGLFLFIFCAYLCSLSSVVNISQDIHLCVSSFCVPSLSWLHVCLSPVQVSCLSLRCSFLFYFVSPPSPARTFSFAFSVLFVRFSSPVFLWVSSPWSPLVYLSL